MEFLGMHDPDVTLTDYGLTLLCLWMVWRIWRGPRLGRTRPWLLLFFAGVGIGAGLGGTVHGFFEFEGTPGYDVLWPATLISIGLAALGAWGIGARLILKEGIGSGLIGLAAIEFIAYSGAVIGGYQSFAIAVFQYLPGTIFLIVAVVIANRRKPRPGFPPALAGLALTLVAAGVQQQQFSVHPVYFDHNAVYHVIQAVALILFYRGMTQALRA